MFPSINFESSSEAKKLAAAIHGLIPSHKEILKMSSAWDLLFLDEFKNAPIHVSLDMADWALRKAQSDWELAHKDETRPRVVVEDET